MDLIIKEHIRGVVPNEVVVVEIWKHLYSKYLGLENNYDSLIHYIRLNKTNCVSYE